MQIRLWRDRSSLHDLAPGMKADVRPSAGRARRLRFPLPFNQLRLSFPSFPMRIFAGAAAGKTYATLH